MVEIENIGVTLKLKPGPHKVPKKNLLSMIEDRIS